MTSAENLQFEKQNSVLTITINRPDALNALNRQTMSEVRTAMSEIEDDEEIRGVILTGAGDRAFVAGADIKELSEVNEITSRKLAEDGQETFDAIEKLNKPVIALVNGFALGGGCELAMACHIRIATENAKFGLPEVTLGVIPGYGGTQRLSRLVGSGRALEMILTGNMIDASKSAEIGLVNYVYATKEEAHAQAMETLGAISDRAPLAIAEAIQCVNAGYGQQNDGFQKEANAFARLCSTEDFAEGTSAFIEKRKPNFMGK